jgi:outer membrane lipoprotein-sorting protein
MISFFLSLLLCAPVVNVSAQGSADGDVVIAAVDRHEEGYRDIRSNVTMILADARGQTRKRHLDVYALELTPLGDRRKFVFNKPADIDGTAVLIHSNVVENDDQWIFLPAFKRVKRIASSNKSTPFVGSEFSYEDLASQEKEKYTNHYVDSTTLDGVVCDVIERIPRFPHSAYSRLLAYIDRQDHRYRRVEYFDQSGKHIKTQYLEDYRLYDGRYLLPNKTVMVNHATGRQTTMLWDDIRLKTAQTDNQFTTNALKRIR